MQTICEKALIPIHQFEEGAAAGSAAPFFRFRVRQVWPDEAAAEHDRRDLKRV